MEVLEQFLEQYNKQYDFYFELSRIGYTKLESELNKRGIKAIVSNRAKKPSRLRTKISQRNSEKKYKNVQQIFDDLVDLAGVRVALYFPSDRELVDEIVKDLFEVKKRKLFPEDSHKPKYTKRFSGYWATHYKVVLNNTEKEYERYLNTQFEIQVASVLMHAWSEVEHDLVYKPLSGNLSEEELAILDEINGLVLSGEIALERLQKAITKRTKERNEITDRYELTNFIINSLNKNYINKLKLGNPDILNNYFNTIYKIDTDTFSKYINNINKSEDETISDQLLNMLFNDYLEENISEKPIKQYFQKILGTDRDTSGFELFIKTWIILERSISILNEENNIKHRKYFAPKLEILQKYSFSNIEIKELNRFRELRNQLMHGIDPPPNKYLNNKYIRLRELTEKTINHINDTKRKDNLLNELNDLRAN